MVVKESNYSLRVYNCAVRGKPALLRTIQVTDPNHTILDFLVHCYFPISIGYHPESENVKPSQIPEVLEHMNKLVVSCTSSRLKTFTLKPFKEELSLCLENMAIAIAISDCMKYVALGMVGDIQIYKLSYNPPGLILFKRVAKAFGGRPVTDLFFFSKSECLAIFSLSYGHNYLVLQLDPNILDAQRTGQGGEGSAKEREKYQPSNIQVVCLTPRWFYFIKNNELKVNRM